MKTQRFLFVAMATAWCALGAFAAETSVSPAVQSQVMPLERSEASTEADRVLAARNVVLSREKAVPSQKGDWEKIEEPALRPYKALLRGVGAFGYQSLRGFVEGNEKFPVLGSVEVFRGMRRGTIEFVSCTTMGLAGASSLSYRTLGKANRTIEDDPGLNFMADVTASAIPGLAGAAGAEGLAAGAASFYAAQKAVDHSPVDPNRAEKKYEREVMKAQRQYIGDRALLNVKQNDTGNLLKKYGGK